MCLGMRPFIHSDLMGRDKKYVSLFFSNDKYYESEKSKEIFEKVVCGNIIFVNVSVIWLKCLIDA